MPMQRAVPIAFFLAVATVCAAPVADAQSAGAGAECEVCTARHKSLQALQRARAQMACADDATAPCAPSVTEKPPGAEPPDPADGAALSLPEGRPVGAGGQ